MEQPLLNWITNFIWGIADDVLRDLYVRGKYRDVILPMTVLRRLDAVLEPTKQSRARHEGHPRQGGHRPTKTQALRQAAGQAFYNTSQFTLRDLRARASQQQLKADFEAYLDGFSPNVQDILDKFEFRNQIPRLSKADALGTLIEKFLVARINLSPNPVLNGDGSVKHARPRQPCHGHDLRGAGSPLQRGEQRRGGRALDSARCREADGEADLPAHRRPDRVRHLPALRRRLRHRRHADRRRRDAAANSPPNTASRSPPTSTGRRSTPRPTPSPRPICCSRAKARRRTTSSAARSTRPCRTTRSPPASSTSCFRIRLTARAGRAIWSAWAARAASRTRASSSSTAATRSTRLITRSSDGQMLFLANMLCKMKHDTKLGSRIAEVHNGSSLFTGDAGQGESNIRRWIIENDWLEAIVALPLNMFYNTGIATYVWVLTNRKPEHRQGQGATDRRHAVVQAAAQEPGQEELRTSGRGHRAHLRHVPAFRRETSSRRSSPMPRSATGR